MVYNNIARKWGIKEGSRKENTAHCQKGEKQMELIKGIIAIIYLLASWWAFHVLFEGTTLFGSLQDICVFKWVMPIFFGFILIPIAIIKSIISAIID